MECQKERKDLYHGISSARKETFSFNERSGRVFFLPSLSAVAVRQQLQCKNQVSRMKTRTRATALIQKKKEECPVTLRTHQEKQIPPRQFLQLKTWSKILSFVIYIFHYSFAKLFSSVQQNAFLLHESCDYCDLAHTTKR